jgi:hypothetical protein
MSQKLSLETPLAQPHFHPNFPMWQLVSTAIIALRLISFLLSHTHYQTRPLYTCRHDTNVQNSRSKLFDHGIQFECAIS